MARQNAWKSAYATVLIALAARFSGTFEVRADVIWDRGVSRQAIAAELTWDQQGPNVWNSAHWLGPPGSPAFPDLGTDATIRSDVVSVIADAAARSLAVPSGGLLVAAGKSLTVTQEVVFGTATQLTMGDDTTLSAAAGSLPIINTLGNAILEVTSGVMAVAGYCDGGPAGPLRVFTKAGPGVLLLDNRDGKSLVADSTTLRITGGRLQSTGARPLGASAAVELVGGTLALPAADYEAEPATAAITLTVAADSTLQMDGDSATRLGNLVLSQGVLATAGNSEIAFRSIAITPDATAIGLNTGVATRCGPLARSGGAPVTITKSGPAALVLGGDTMNLNNATFWVRQGTLVALPSVTHANPLGTAQVQLDGGELTLTSRTVCRSASFENAVKTTSDSTLTASYAGYGAAGPLTVTLGSPSRGLAVEQGTLTLQALDSYILRIGGPISGAGAIRCSQGNVVLSGGGSIGSATLCGGRLELGGDLHAGTFRVDSGTLNTGGHQVVVSDQFVLRNTHYRSGAGATFAVQGAEVQSQANLTLSGGVLTIGQEAAVAPAGAVARWKFDETSGALAADSTGSCPGTLVGEPQWRPADGLAGGALALDGIDDYVEVPGMDLRTNKMTFAMWVNGHRATDWAGLIMSRVGANSGIGFGKNDRLHYTWNTDTTWKWDNGPEIPRDRWAFVAVTIAPDRATAYLGLGGALTSVENLIPHSAEPFLAPRIGRDGAMNRYFCGLIDDVCIYDRTLSPSEMAELYSSSGISREPLPTENTSLHATADSTVRALGADDIAFNNVTLDTATSLSIAGLATGIKANTLSSGHGARVQGNVRIESMLAPGERLGTLAVNGTLRLDAGATYVADVGRALHSGGPDCDRVEVSGEVRLLGTLNVQAASRVKAPWPAPDSYGPQSRTILRTLTTAGEAGIQGAFAGITPDPTDPTRASPYLDHGVTLERVCYVKGEASPQNPDPAVLAIEVELFQAGPGDCWNQTTKVAGVDRMVDVPDIQQILRQARFNSNKPAVWTDGDFNDDGLVTSADIQMMLSANLFKKGLYGTRRAAAAEGAAPHLQLKLTPEGLVIDSQGAVINGYVLTSAQGLLTGEPAENLGVFQVDDDYEISGQMFFALGGEHLLGQVAGMAVSPAQLAGDLKLTYTVTGQEGAYESTLIVPEPAAMALLLSAALAMPWAWRRRPERRSGDA